MSIKNQSGQGLVEYLILVAIIGVAAIGITRVVGYNLKRRMTEVAFSLQGEEKDLGSIQINERYYQKSDLGNFMKGSATNESDKSNR